MIGFGVTGLSAVRYLLDHGIRPADLIVVDRRREAIEEATELGAHAVLGDGTNRLVLTQATSGHVLHVVVAVVPDEAAVQATMLARGLWPTATIATAVRSLARVAFVRRHGADHVVTTSESAGTALVHALHKRSGLATSSPPMPSAMPWTVDQRPAQASEVGHELHDCVPTAVGVLRGSRRYWGAEAARLRLAADDQIVVLQSRTPTCHTET
ncbi:NAD(P)-binding protein [Lentzea albidocapillata]|uniref:NAD(P)-binding protein n=1 Tax=Lentzea albidocapillata TaxID=40571 RepID=UPI0004C2EE12|nr:NAD(P)-binding protein [Lentzea albidocapillata]